MNAILRKFISPSIKSENLSTTFTWKTICVLIEILFFLAIALYSFVQGAGAAVSIEGLRLTKSNIQDDPGSNMTLLGSLGGPILDVVVQGSYAFAGIGPSLNVIELSDPGTLTPAASLLLSDTLVDMELDPPYLVIATTHMGLYIVDISNPLNPTQTGFLNQEWIATGLAVEGGYAFVTQAYNGLEIIDISDPVKPIEVANYSPGSNFLDIQVTGNFAYALETYYGNPGIHILDLSNPAAPVQVGYVSGEVNNSGRLAIASHYLYVLGDTSGLQIFDITSPTAPVMVGSLPLAADGMDIALAGDTAYLAWRTEIVCSANCQGGLLVVDIADPASPQEIGRYASPGSALSLGLAGDHVLLTRPDVSIYPLTLGGGTLESISISNPQSPVLLGSLSSPINHPGEIALAGSLAYVADNSAGSSKSSLRVVDVASPGEPILLSSFPFLGDISGIKIDGGLAYITELPQMDDAGQPTGIGGGLHILDVSNPLSLVEVGRFGDSEGRYGGVDVDGSYAYLAWKQFCVGPVDTCRGRLWIVDVSNPTDPQELGHYEDQGFPVVLPVGVAVQDNFAYLPAEMGGLWIVDVTDPANPNRIAKSGGGIVTDVAVSGDIAYVANWWLGVNIVDIHNPASPVPISTAQHHDQSGNVYAVAEANNRLYAATIGSGGLTVFDVADPSEPVEMAFYPAIAEHTSVAVSGGIIYLSLDSQGLITLQLTGSVSGAVLQPNRVPAAGATITANGTYSTTTGIDGAYRIEDLKEGSYMITPSAAGLTFMPSQREVYLPPDAVANFTLLPTPASTELSPGITTTLTYTDTQGLPTRLVFPAGAVISETQVVLTPTITMDLAGFAFAGHAFELGTFQGGALAPELRFSAPVSVTIQYSAADMALISDPAGLAFWWWDGSAWQDSSAGCPAPGNNMRSGADGIFQSSICTTGLFALFGPTHSIYIPVITNDLSSDPSVAETCPERSEGTLLQSLS